MELFLTNSYNLTVGSIGWRSRNSEISDYKISKLNLTITRTSGNNEITELVISDSFINTCKLYGDALNTIKFY